MAADILSRATRERRRRFFKDDAGEQDVSVVLELLSKRSQNKQVLMARSTTTEKAIASKPKNQEKNEQEGYTERKKDFDDK